MNNDLVLEIEAAIEAAVHGDRDVTRARTADLILQAVPVLPASYWAKVNLAAAAANLMKWPRLALHDLLYAFAYPGEYGEDGAPRVKAIDEMPYARFARAVRELATAAI